MATSCEGAKEQLTTRLFLMGKKPSGAWLVGCTGQVEAFAHTFEIQPQPRQERGAGGGFGVWRLIPQFPPLPVPHREHAGQAACR